MLSVTRKMNVVWQRFDTKINFCVVLHKQTNQTVCIYSLFCFWGCSFDQASARSPLPVLPCAVVSFSVQRQLGESLLQFDQLTRRRLLYFTRTELKETPSLPACIGQLQQNGKISSLAWSSRKPRTASASAASADVASPQQLLQKRGINQCFQPQNTGETLSSGRWSPLINGQTGP